MVMTLTLRTGFSITLGPALSFVFPRAMRTPASQGRMESSNARGRLDVDPGSN